MENKTGNLASGYKAQVLMLWSLKSQEEGWQSGSSGSLPIKSEALSSSPSSTKKKKKKESRLSKLCPQITLKTR
jgi:hypothetical protein